MGRAWKFGDNLNTDEIMPARYNITIDEKELASKVFCEVRPDYAPNVRAGDVIVGGWNFGCGSSREHAPVAIRGSGAACVIAPSFARIFFRNAINIGLPILECPEAVEGIEDGDEVEVNLEEGWIFNRSKGTRFQARPLPAFVLKIVQAGGLVKFLREHNIEELAE
uniref:3-isopropylmalate dehydratase small subunit n=1 Tax=Anaerolinea thermolimosa TaxID=229919 RepID=A0A7C4PJC6_9CHLR